MSAMYSEEYILQSYIGHSYLGVSPIEPNGPYF